MQMIFSHRRSVFAWLHAPDARHVVLSGPLRIYPGLHDIVQEWSTDVLSGQRTTALAGGSMIPQFTRSQFSPVPTNPGRQVHCTLSPVVLHSACLWHSVYRMDSSSLVAENDGSRQIKRFLDALIVLVPAYGECFSDVSTAALSIVCWGGVCSIFLALS